MKKGKLFTWGAVALMMAFSLAACGGSEDTPSSAGSSQKSGELTDGFYMAQEDTFSEKTGWKYVVTLKVKDGQMTEALWNGAHVSAGETKVTQSRSGDYGMEEKGGAQSPWFEQAAKAEEFLLKNQDPAAITYKDDEGHTDAISGVSIHVVEFFDLAEKALKAGPVERGPYKDGHYHGEDPEFSHGWKTTVDLTVIGGYIVAANWDALGEEDGGSKKEASLSGEYGMAENGGAQSLWAEQVALAEEHLLETQDPADITYKDDEGHTDAISGVTIHVNEFFSLAEKILEKR